MRNSIKIKLVGNFMLIILLTVIIFVGIVLFGIKTYYYDSVKEILKNQVLYSTDLYNRYYADYSLEEIILEDTDMFWKNTTAQVQIFDVNGKLLLDSIGNPGNLNKVRLRDVETALQGEVGSLISRDSDHGEELMSVSYQLRDRDSIVGVLRFTTSLNDVEKETNKSSALVLSFGGLVILISSIASIFISRSITRPIEEVTKVAAMMADGQLNMRSVKYSNDEIGKLSDTINILAENILIKDKLKNDFISSISHELRTPLTSIKGWAMTLQGDENPDYELINEGLIIIEKESDRLTGMVEELLDFSRFVSGRISLNKEEFNLIKVINQITTQFKIKANEKNIQIKTIYTDKELKLIGDKDRVKQVLINLLDNALKFTDPGGKINIYALKSDDGLIFEVEDNGCGIPEEDLPFVKDKFYKGSNSKSHSGLGLSICDEIVKLHNGVFIIESREGQGTKATVFLPNQGGVE